MALAEDELPDSVPPVIRTGSDRPWFAICTPAIVTGVLVSYILAEGATDNAAVSDDKLDE